MTDRFHADLPGRHKPEPEPGGPLGVYDQVEILAVQLLDHLASDTCVCEQGTACGMCLLSVVESNDYAQHAAAWAAASVSLGIANFGPKVSLGAAAARWAITTTGRRGRNEKESFAGELLTGPLHRHDGYDRAGRPRCWCGSIAERDHATGDLVCTLAGVALDVADDAAVVQSGRITEAVDDMAFTVESAWRRFLVAEPAAEPGELGLPAHSSRGDALRALHRMRSTLHSVFGVDETRRAQLCLWPTAAPDDNHQHVAVAGEYEDTIACLCGGPLIDGGDDLVAGEITCARSKVVIWQPDHQHLAVAGDGDGKIACACGGPISDGREGKGPRLYQLSPGDVPVSCVRTGTVIWSPEPPNRETDADRAAAAEARLMQIPYEDLGPAARTLRDNPRGRRSGGLEI